MNAILLFHIPDCARYVLGAVVFSLGQYLAWLFWSGRVDPIELWREVRG